jgi:glycosyltransferase involved in cell wall biosynthesis
MSRDGENGNDKSNFRYQFNVTGTPVKVLYVSSYVPRKCGVANYTKDLVNSVNLINPLKPGKILALDNVETEKINYPDDVVLRMHDDSPEDMKKAVRFINKSKSIDVVSLQHEYNLYGGDNGEMVIDFIKRIKKPVVTTIHNVMAGDTEGRKKVIKQISQLSKFCVVMLQSSAEVLHDVFDVPKEKIFAIRHGIPDLQKISSDSLKKELGLEGKIVMSSINLLTKWKGIEYAIRSLTEVVKAYPNFLYLVIGETHPVWYKKFDHGDYRKMLIGLVKKFGLENNVMFVNEYVDLYKLIKYVQASDFYITPYIARQQAASGALSYAIGAGKVCISTSYLYAKEMLGRGRGVLVPFGSTKPIARSIISVLQNEEKRKWYENKAYEIGRTMTWARVGHQYFHLFQNAAS